MWLKASNINCVHGFSNRKGGVSPAPFDSLNLGGHEDEPSNIKTNRKIALKELGLGHLELCNLKQVHGNTVQLAKCGQQEGDALVTNKKDLILAVSIADCYPLLFHDPVNKVIGAAHAGWRGTVNKIAEATLHKMFDLGAKAENIEIAIGQGIAMENFEVGDEVVEEFKEKGFPETCWTNRHIDLIKCNVHVLRQNNIPEKNIWSMNRCTFEPDFFSYRRDKGITGRMWAVIALN
ncbi:MAG: peptidoglycan editing factor PgeF [Bacteroidetes bacterium]|nr:peptidoglycan editing factor PgeF [Bacteroidota bacterium]